MIIPYKRFLIAPVLVIALMQSACGGALASFRLALASSGPLVNSLVAAGVLKQEQAGPIIADFTDGADVALTLQTDFKACEKDRACKLKAAQKASIAFRAIINRHHFSVNARIQQIADIADGILASLVIYYGGGSSRMESSAANLSDEDIEKKLTPDVEKLKALMKVKN